MGLEALLAEVPRSRHAATIPRRHGFSEASYYLWRSKFGRMSVSDAKRLKELEIENTRLKKPLADSLRWSCLDAPAFTWSPRASPRPAPQSRRPRASSR